MCMYQRVRTKNCKCVNRRHDNFTAPARLSKLNAIKHLSHCPIYLLYEVERHNRMKAATHCMSLRLVIRHSDMPSQAELLPPTLAAACSVTRGTNLRHLNWLLPTKCFSVLASAGKGAEMCENCEFHCG
ncbi:unnamed protein product [Hydatigera taeniaeformis]|uniref:Secreted protein n=1 Tax=Hydatigena taeniaeformis TaxID=6205 RepID=A0A0R3WTX7_HYDTA|nr:unnamed protein product [Hydatigera taeniaeformis]